jgi:hypothetical protein
MELEAIRYACKGVELMSFLRFAEQCTCIPQSFLPEGSPHRFCSLDESSQSTLSKAAA